MGKPDQLLWILNAYYEDIPFMLPKIGRKTSSWEVVVDTFTGQLSPGWKDVKGSREYVALSRSTVLLRLK